MKRFFIQLSLFSICTLLLFGLRYAYKPYHWGAKTHTEKLADVESIGTELNTFFFGSSHVASQIIPTVFDNFAKTTNSYNMGISAAQGIETCYVLRNFLADHHDQVQNVFVELWAPGVIRQKNIDKARSIYYMDLRSLKLYIEYRSSEKSQDFGTYIMAFLRNFVNQRSSLFSPGIGHNYFRDYYAVERGYEDLGLAYHLSMEKQRKGSAIQRRNQFTRSVKNGQFVAPKIHNRIVGRLILTMNEIESIARDYKNVQFFIFGHPILVNYSVQELETANVKILGLDASKINKLISNPDMYHDKNHLNRSGATEFSRQLAEAFIRMN